MPSDAANNKTTTMYIRSTHVWIDADLKWKEKKLIRSNWVRACVCSHIYEFRNYAAGALAQINMEISCEHFQKCL